MLQSTISEGHKFLVFSYLFAIWPIGKEYLEKEGNSVCILDGATQTRQAQVKIFKNKKKTRYSDFSKSRGCRMNLNQADMSFYWIRGGTLQSEAQRSNRGRNPKSASKTKSLSTKIHQQRFS